MIVVMEQGASVQYVDGVVARLTDLGFRIHMSKGVERTIIGAVGDNKERASQFLEAMPGVEKVVAVLKPYKMASREFRNTPTIVMVGPVAFGGATVPVIAGPCAVESEEQLLETAQAVKAAGATMLRGGAFKPRTSPYAFQGLEEEGLKMLAYARDLTGLPVVTEVVNPRDIELVAKYADMVQIGARNMQNFTLLKEVGVCGKPVLLKRGLSATIEEWLMAAEYIMASGNTEVVLCERGIRTFETATRNTMDISAIPLVKSLSHLPVIADPSHASGRWKLVEPLAMASVAAGADGVIVEVHIHPDQAMSDGPQTLTPENFSHMMSVLKPLALAVGREL